MRRNSFFSGLIFTFLLKCAFAQSIQWETIHPQPDFPPLSSVTFGEGRFVAGGQGGLFYSEDGGRSWKIGTNNIPFRILAVLHTNEQFVAVGLGNQIFTSQDGLAWESHLISGSAGLLSIAYGGGLYVATGNEGLIVTSPDAHIWTTQNSSSTGTLLLSAYGNGRFLVHETGLPGFPFVTSTNGTDWTRFNAAVPNVDPNCVANPRFPPPCLTYEAFAGLVFANGQFVATARYSAMPGQASTKVLTSPDGTTWTMFSNADAGSANIIAFGSGINSFTSTVSSSISRSRTSPLISLTGPASHCPTPHRSFKVLDPPLLVLPTAIQPMSW